jgi:hypothetical protein
MTHLITALFLPQIYSDLEAAQIFANQDGKLFGVRYARVGATTFGVAANE